jgi:hypothetical protein
MSTNIWYSPLFFKENICSEYGKVPSPTRTAWCIFLELMDPVHYYTNKDYNIISMPEIFSLPYSRSHTLKHSQC